MQIVIDVKNENVLEKVLWLLRQIKGVEIYEELDESIKTIKAEENLPLEKCEKWEYWNEEELKNFGKLTYGLSSNDFNDANEDYSKW